MVALDPWHEAPCTLPALRVTTEESAARTYAAASSKGMRCSHNIILVFLDGFVILFDSSDGDQDQLCGRSPSQEEGRPWPVFMLANHGHNN